MFIDAAAPNPYAVVKNAGSITVGELTGDGILVQISGAQVRSNGRSYRSRDGERERERSGGHSAQFELPAHQANGTYQITLACNPAAVDPSGPYTSWGIAVMFVHLQLLNLFCVFFTGVNSVLGRKVLTQVSCRNSALALESLTLVPDMTGLACVAGSMSVAIPIVPAQAYALPLDPPRRDFRSRLSAILLIYIGRSRCYRSFPHLCLSLS